MIAVITGKSTKKTPRSGSDRLSEDVLQLAVRAKAKEVVVV